MPTIVITGANRGIGLEFARQYAEDGWTVIGTAREPGRARELQATGAEVRGLDAADPASVNDFADALQGRAVDVLLHNAGFFGGQDQGFGQVWDPGTWDATMRTNAMAPLMLTQALVDNLMAGEQRRVPVLTSRMGSIADNGSGGYYVYRASKAAANAVVKSMAEDLKARGIIATALHPGWVQTEMGGPNAMLTPAESAANLRRVIAGMNVGYAGRFLNHDGQEIPW